VRRRWAITIVAGALAFTTMPRAGAAPRAPRWVQEAGGHYWQYGYDVAVDDTGNAWVVGSSTGKFPKAHSGVSRRATTAFLAQVDHRGAVVYATQFGTASTAATAIVRAVDGKLDVVGWSNGPDEFPGTTDDNAGKTDAFVRQYDADGDHVWTHRFGSSEADEALGVATDAGGNLYVVGSTGGAMPGAPEAASSDGDGWIAKYAPDGTLAWVHQVATDRSDSITGVTAVPGGGVTVVGQTQGDLAGAGSNHGYSDIFVAHYGANGTRAWLKQIGTQYYDAGSAIASDASGHLFVVGNTPGALPGWAGRTEFYGDAFLLELDDTGDQVAVKEFGVEGRDIANAVAVDAQGDVFVTGDTEGRLRGVPETNSYGTDAFVARFAPAAHHDGLRTAWIHQIGAGTVASGTGIAVTADGTVTMAGWAGGPIAEAGHYGGATDALVARFGRVN
jgi:Beta-propeller repeat